VGRWSPEECQFRFFRVMWESMEWVGTNDRRRCSNKVAVSIKNWLPRVTWCKSFGGTFV
jgi:hypothetical protein